MTGPDAVPRARAWRRLGLGFAHPGAGRAWGLVLLGLLLAWVSTPPGPAPVLVLVADVPLLWLVFPASGRPWRRWALLYGVLRYALALHWLARIHPAQVVGASVALLPVWFAAVLLLRWLARRRVPWLLAVPTVLVLEEMARTVWLGGMPWPSRALAFAAWPPFVAASAYLGAYALSFLAALASAAVAGPPPSDRPTSIPSWARGVCVRLPVALVLAGVLFGAGRLRDVGEGGEEDELVSTAPGVLLAVQANIPQSLKHAPTPDAGNRIFRRHLDLTRAGLAAVRGAGEEVLAVLWPETMVPWPFFDADVAARFPDEWGNEVRVAQNVRQVVADDPAPPPFLLGAIYIFRRGEERHVDPFLYGTCDSLFLVDPARMPAADAPVADPPPVGEVPPWIRGRHDKHILVPWGEYTPLGDVLPALKRFREFVAEIPELDAGAAVQPPFALPGGASPRGEVTAGTVICFELLFPARCRAWRRQGVGVLLNAANYGWFGPSDFRAQLRAAAALRAAETATTVVVAGNTGPTLLYDPRGRPYGRFETAGGGARPDPEADGNTFRAGWASGPLVLDPEPTPYVRWGDLPWLLLGAAVLLLGFLPRGRSRG